MIRAELTRRIGLNGMGRPTCQPPALNLLWFFWEELSLAARCVAWRALGSEADAFSNSTFALF